MHMSDAKYNLNICNNYEFRAIFHFRFWHTHKNIISK